MNISAEDEESLFESVLFQRSTSAPSISSDLNNSFFSTSRTALDGLLGSRTLDQPDMPSKWNPRFGGNGNNNSNTLNNEFNTLSIVSDTSNISIDATTKESRGSYASASGSSLSLTSVGSPPDDNNIENDGKDRSGSINSNPSIHSIHSEKSVDDVTNSLESSIITQNNNNNNPIPVIEKVIKTVTEIEVNTSNNNNSVQQQSTSSNVDDHNNNNNNVVNTGGNQRSRSGSFQKGRRNSRGNNSGPPGIHNNVDDIYYNQMRRMSNVDTFYQGGMMAGSPVGMLNGIYDMNSMNALYLQQQQQQQQQQQMNNYRSRTNSIDGNFQQWGGGGQTRRGSFGEQRGGHDNPTRRNSGNNMNAMNPPGIAGDPLMGNVYGMGNMVGIGGRMNMQGMHNNQMLQNVGGINPNLSYHQQRNLRYNVNGYDMVNGMPGIGANYGGMPMDIHAPTGHQAQTMDYFHDRFANPNNNSHKNVSSLRSHNNESSNGSGGEKIDSFYRRYGKKNPGNYSGDNPLLDEFKNGNRGRIWELSDIRGNIRIFCLDSQGSRFVQQKLEVCSVEEHNAVLEELKNDSFTLMTNVFANYVIQKLFEFGNAATCESLARFMRGHVVELSLHMYSCRVVQKAFEYINPNQLMRMITEYNCPRLMECISDQNSNHCIQKAIEIISRVARHADGDSKVMLCNSLDFFLQALLGHACEIACNAYGCRVIQRVIEHCSDVQKRPLLQKLSKHIPKLINHQYGNYVLQHIVTYGLPEDRRTLLDHVEHNLIAYSKHKFSSNVVEQCLQNASKPERDRIIWSVINATFDIRRPLDGNDANPSALEILCRDPFANYVLQKVIELADGAQLRSIVAYVKGNLIQLNRYTYGKHIISCLEKLTDEFQ